ncbi:TfoX family protein [Marinomonas agarivorans]|nr:TfoX family protein [Marinomonas agarivorans]
MSYDEKLVNRLRELLPNSADIEEKNMFGGHCFLVNKHMCCGVIGDNLLARVGPRHYNKCTSKNYVKQFEYSGRPIADIVCIEAELTADNEDLASWLSLCQDFVSSLPEKQPRSTVTA